MEATTIPEYASGKKFSSHLFPLSHIAGSKRAVAHSLAWVPMSTPTTTTTTSSSTSSTPSQTALVAASPDGTLWTVHCFAGASRQLQSRIASGGGGVFDLTTCTGIALPLVAAACQDGSIRIWNVVSSKDDNNGTHGFQLQEPPVVTLATAGAPILSVAWRCVRQQLSSSSSSETTVYTELYAGVADGTIRKYHLDLKVQQQGQQEDDASMTFQVLKQTPDLRMTVESRGRRTPTKVWTMQALDDGSLVTGNSLGQVQIWDTVTGTLMQSVTQTELKADVLKIVVNPSQTKLFASGVDSRVVCLERSTSSDRTWKFTTAQRPHTHDVKCMAIVDDALFTAGVDTKLCTYVVSDFAKRRPQVYYPWPSQSPVSTTSTTTTTATTTKSPGSSSRRILSMQRDNHIELYRLNPQEQDQQEKGSGLPATGSELIGEIALETQSNLSISSLSPNGHWLAAANATRLFLFRLNESDDDEDLEPEQVSLPKPLDRITVVALHFCGATNMLFVADSTHRVHVVDLSSTQDEDTISIVSTLRLPLKTGADIPISSLRTSENGKYLVAMTKSSQDGIHVFQRRAESSSSSSSELYSSYWMIPGLANARPAAVAFLGETQLAVATVSFQIYIFDLPGKKLSPWSEANGFPIQKWPSEISHRRDFPVRLFANPQNQSQLIMVRQTATFICHVFCKNCYFQHLPFPAFVGLSFLRDERWLYLRPFPCQVILKKIARWKRYRGEAHFCESL
jgi:U3 small nucleolar RNA-associated protein 4